jgi:type IV pilus assembly protein PilW
MMMESNWQKGFTLIEMMVAMAISGMLMAVVAMAFTGQSRSYNAQQDIVSLQQELRSALQMMAQEIRMAGYDLQGTANAGILTANAGNLKFSEDITNDGDTADSNEIIRYAINTNGVLGREVGGAGGLQPLSQNIVRLAFEYYLSNGTWTQTVTGANLNNIQAVKIVILGRSDRETAGTVDNSSFNPPIVSVAAPDWTPTAPGRFHWRMMSLIVQCRNLAL